MSATVPTREPEAMAVPEALSQRTILRFFSPLAASWVFMSVEGPVAVALISRLPNAVIETAAFQIMMGLALWIESPVIDLLSTSTTLTKTRQNYREISRFVWWLIAWVTVAHAALVLTPLYWVVTEGAMGVTHEVAAASRLGLAVMLPWSGFIGWRRYLQGILIRSGRTHLVGTGTAVRVVMMFSSALALYFFAHLPGIQIAGISLISAVGAEAAFAHWASRATIREQFTRDTPGDMIGFGKLAHFHLPLTATTMVTMIGMPAVSATLARAPNAVMQLAGFQVAYTLVWLMRTTVYALPEVVITLYKDQASAHALRRFCLSVGAIASGVMAVIWISGLDRVYFRSVLGATPEEIAVAHLAFIAPLLMPVIGSMQSYVRGMLTAHHLTVSRLLAVGIAMAALLASLVGVVIFGVAGVVAAGLCLTFGYIAELAVLAIAWRQAVASHRIEPLQSDPP